MKKKAIIFIKQHMIGSIIIISTSIIIFLIISITLFQSNLDGEIAILEAGVENIPVIKNDDLQELGQIYSKLNDQFEREIDNLVTGSTNRHNKSNNTINPLTHYGIYGDENPNPFKNNDYVNGAIIKYEKATASIVDGASNFNDIISVMAILYDQKMDTIETEELKKVFTDMFWLSHTYTFDSTELYPCKQGCTAQTSYKCTAVYNNYSTCNVLQYDPFTVRRHRNYEDKGYYYDEDFRIVLPEGQCEICGIPGAGCVWRENKVCYHGSSHVSIASCEEGANTIEDICFGEVGEIYKAEDLQDEFISDDDTKGAKIDKLNNKCRYYREIKFCNTRKSLAENIRNVNRDIERNYERWGNHKEPEKGECGTCKSCERTDERLQAELESLNNQLDYHITYVCEKDETTSRFWCNGYKVCFGHKTHYTCPSPGHKLVCCLGHTNINVTINVLYKDELIDKAFEVFK